MDMNSDEADDAAMAEAMIAFVKDGHRGQRMMVEGLGPILEQLHPNVPNMALEGIVVMGEAQIAVTLHKTKGNEEMAASFLVGPAPPMPVPAHIWVSICNELLIRRSAMELSDVNTTVQL